MLKVTLMFISVGAVGATLIGSRLHAHGASAARKVDHDWSDLRVTAGNAKSLDIKIPLGKVTVYADASHDMTVHVIRSTKGPMDETAKKWLNDSFVTAENNNGALVVRDHPFGKDSLKGLNSSGLDGDGKKGRSLDLEVQIHVPADLAAKLNVTAGEAELQGRFRSLNAEVSAGELRTNAVRSSGSLALNVGAGSLSASVAGPEDLKVGAGEVKLSIPAGVGADVRADVGIGEIEGLPSTSHKSPDSMQLGDKRHGRTGRGDSHVEIHVGTGSIKVNAEDHIEGVAVAEAPAGKGFALTLDKDLDKAEATEIDEDVNESVKEALADAKESMESADIDMKMDKLDKLQDLDKLGDIDVQVSKSMKDLGPTIDKAMKEAMRQMKEVQPEIDKAMREAHVEIERAMKSLKPEIERAMKEIKPQMEKAIREAMKEMEKALKEIEKSEKVHGE